MSKKRFTIKSYLLFGLLGAFLMLIGYNMRDAILGATFSVNAALDGSTVQSLVLPISGSAAHSKQISINGRLVAIHPNGTFSDETILSPGYNVIEVASVDSFGNRKTKVLHIVAQTPQALASAPQTTYQQ